MGFFWGIGGWGRCVLTEISECANPLLQPARSAFCPWAHHDGLAAYLPFMSVLPALSGVPSPLSPYLNVSLSSGDFVTPWLKALDFIGPGFRHTRTNPVISWSLNFLLQKMAIITGATLFDYSVEEYMGWVQEVLDKQQLLFSESYFIEVEDENKP